MRAGELLPVHAVAGPVRTRSHFEAQDLMESGADQRLTSGWLNRAVQGMAAGRRRRRRRSRSASPLPLLLRGPAPVGAYAPQSFSSRSRTSTPASRAARPRPGHRPRRPRKGWPGARLHRRAARAHSRRRRPASATPSPPSPAPPAGCSPPPTARASRRWSWAAGTPTPAKLQRLAAPLKQLDDGLAALRDGLGDAWQRTAVLVMTEFGRTVHANGTGGTDHGTGTVAFLAGGAVAGGRVLADWPGLADGQLLEGRDLQPTLDLRALAKGLLAAHLRLDRRALLAPSRAARTCRRPPA